MAETLRRLGETAGTGLDYATLQKVLTVSGGVETSLLKALS